MANKTKKKKIISNKSTSTEPECRTHKSGTSIIHRHRLLFLLLLFNADYAVMKDSQLNNNPMWVTFCLPYLFFFFFFIFVLLSIYYKLICRAYSMVFFFLYKSVVAFTPYAQFTIHNAIHLTHLIVRM